MGESQSRRTVGDYEVALDAYAEPAPQLRCRNASGRELKKLPPALKNEPAVQELKGLAEWVGDHAAEARSHVERWMSRSLPVPTALVRAVWSDPYWRRALRYAVVAPYAQGPDGGPDIASAGLLTDVDPGPDGALRATGVDGSVSIHAPLLALPHPVLLDPQGTGQLERWHDLLDTFGGEQHIEQLHRTVWVRPDSSPAPLPRIPYGIWAFDGADYESGARFARVVSRFDGTISGESVHYSFSEAGLPHGLTLDLRYQGPMSAVGVHQFDWSRTHGRHGPGAYDTVPRVAWSEGVRAMAAVFDECDAPMSGEPLEADSTAAYQKFLVGCAEYGAVAPSPAEPAPPLARATDAQLLAAGAVLPGSPAGPDEEHLTARAYDWAALDAGDRIVRLVPRRAGAAEDVVADVLGLTPDTGTGQEVGRVRTRPLGFLARVCVARPQSAHLAMSLLSPMRRCAEQAPAKPGRSAGQLRDTLVRSTGSDPGLLPYALDEGARIVARAGSAAMARPLFGEAREADRKLGGPVDEDAHQELLSESAQLGIVTVKVLKEYRAEVAARTTDAESYRRYREIVRDWCRSGQEIPGAFAVDLTTGTETPLPDDDTNTEILAALLTRRGLEKAAPGVWAAWLPTLRRLLREQPELGDELLRLTSVPRGGSAAALARTAESWLDLLANVGVLARLTGEAASADHIPVPAAQRWLTLFLVSYQGMRLPVTGLESVLAAVARRTAAAGETRQPLAGLRTPLDRASTWRAGQNLELLAAQLRLGMPFADLEPYQRLEALHWLEKRGTAEVEALLAEPRFRDSIREELQEDVRGQLAYTVGRHPLGKAPKAARRIAERAPLRELLDEVLAQRAAQLSEGDSRDRLYAWQALLLHTEPLLHAKVAEHFEGPVRTALGADATLVLAETVAALCADAEHGAEPDAGVDGAAAGCPFAAMSADQARTVLAASGAELRALATGGHTGDPRTRAMLYLDVTVPERAALFRPVWDALDGFTDERCRTRASAVLLGVLECEEWQRELRALLD
ncbi:DUF4132 domain-containing protein [Streptomyces sp. NPDC004111]|uniref:DUF4132 domain-containing protein n=1 Tax=Streptomyces sp. NPDC004111 TaxID=3364690 RepID=UPI0036A2CE38